MPETMTSQFPTDFLGFDHLITTRPHDIRQVLISDLHLSHEEPALVQAFLSLLDNLQVLPDLKALYILGDWFDAWIGDDAYLSLSPQQKRTHWLTPLVDQLSQLHANGCHIYVMHGNRDFMLGQPFCDSFGGQLIDEPYTLNVGHQRIRLEHGDALCTDDKAYQRFRRLIRNRWVKKFLLAKSLSKRRQLAEKMRQKSQASNARKTQYIMDVNQAAVLNAVKPFDAILHGHTHRPALHPITPIKPAKLSQETQDSEVALAVIRQKSRYVLGDWRVKHSNSNKQYVEAVIGIIVVGFTNIASGESFINTQLSSESLTPKKPSKSADVTEFLLVKFRA
ncbi:MAG: UDP-2,3-diacylglucosamine diphosphatase [Psychrobacter sp.]|nr:UDP-2,3-diacylglucosamine diphosphatase [Psychrobacter sp.]